LFRAALRVIAECAVNILESNHTPIHAFTRRVIPIAPTRLL